MQGVLFSESFVTSLTTRLNGEYTDELAAVAFLSRAAILSTSGGDFVDVGNSPDAGTAIQLQVMRTLDACGRTIWMFADGLPQVPEALVDAYRVRIVRSGCNATSQQPRSISFLRIRSCNHDCILSTLRGLSARLADNAVVLSHCYHSSTEAKTAVDRFRYEVRMSSPINTVQDTTRQGKVMGAGAWWHVY